MNEIDERTDGECIPNSHISSTRPASQTSAAPPRFTASFLDGGCGHTSYVRGRLTSSRFVGRQSQLAELELAYREALDGNPRLLLIAGDSGVGKTRLLSEARGAFEAARVLFGQCIEQGELELPYAPLLGALRPLVRGQDPVLQGLSAGSRGHLATLLPTLGPANPGDGGGADGQMRLFESLLELLHLLSVSQPLVLVLEDMHWADRSTRAFAAFLARSLIGERALVLLSYRSDELHRKHPLRPLLAELVRLDTARLIELEPFDRDELTEALTDILGEQPDNDLTERLLSRTDGNALYVEELLAAALDGRGATPQSLRDAFMLRIERMSSDAGQAARAVAVGRAMDESMISRLTGIDSGPLREALREAVAEQVLIADDHGRFSFRHALLREVVYDDLLPGERNAMHLELARQLESTGELACAEDEAGRVAVIATHYAAAGDQSAALRATIRAAREARRVHAYGEMADLYERAHGLWARVADAEAVAGIDEVELLEEAANAYALNGDMRHSEMLAEHGLKLLDPGLDPVRYARLLVRRGRSRWRLNQAQSGSEDLERALTLLPDEPSLERARLLSWIARTRTLRGHYREAIREGERAREVAEAAGLPVVVGEVLNTLGMANIALGEVAAGEALLREAITLAREQDDLDDLGTAYSNLAEFLNLAGRTRDALAVIEEGVGEVSAAHGQAFSWMTMTLSELAFEAGDWDRARANIGPPLGSMVGVALMFRLLRDAEFALGEGDEELTRARLREAEPLVRVTGEAQWHGLYGSLLGELSRRGGELDEAQAAVARALDELEVCTDDVMRIARVTAVGAAVEADRALRARDLREPETEADALARANIHLSRLEAAAEDGGPVEAGWLTVGIAEVARARGEHAPALWQRAAESWEALERPYCAATASWRQAEALVGTDDRSAASAVAASALEVAERLGAGWLTDELHGLRARARLEVAVAAPAGAEAPEAGDDDANEELPFGLTPRELQVLTLIAEGATNRQIGTALFMAEKTASVHVSRILTKLGVRSRTQAAAMAHRLHLT
ncbi:MAG TPA: AAA family ATPase [Solirubrobacteraceae bacterium]|nr:AAA family ATPase [Solirubrobacteraceae bacterium]